MKHVAVTDHAVVRYLERALGLDVEAVRTEIARAVKRGIAEGASGVRVGGLWFRLEGAVVVTVLPGSSADLRTGRRPRRGQPRESRWGEEA